MCYMTVSALNDNYNGDRLNVNGNNWNDNNDNGHAFGIALAPKTHTMKTYNNLYEKIISFDNLYSAYLRARKGKTRKDYVIKFEENLEKSLLDLHYELKEQTYSPEPLKTFVLRDPKTRKISKSAFRDRVIHHAIVRILEPIFDKEFIYDSCASRIGKGNLFALQRFYKFFRKVSRNGKQKGWFNDNQVKGYCLKADIKHYFQEVDCNILVNIVKRKIADEKVIWMIRQILQNKANFGMQRERERERYRFRRAECLLAI